MNGCETGALKKVYKYIDENMDLYIDWLLEAVRQPSISMYNSGMNEMASLCVHFLEDKLGLKTNIIETGGSPYIYAYLDEGAKDTLAFYNHYDVMPVEPLEEWESYPFEPVIRDGRIWGRGTADNKGSMFSRICAVHACKQIYSKIPVNLKFFYDGEEEIGSPHLDDFMLVKGGLLECDGFFWEGGSRDLERGRPHITLGVKGICKIELSCRTAGRDLHSANAAIVANPFWRLVWALASMKNDKEEILIDGYVDDIAPLSDKERKIIHDMSFDEEASLRSYGISSFLNGDKGGALKERLVNSPTININGFKGTSSDTETKTILPGNASVFLDLRLAVGQTPESAMKKIRRHLDRKGFSDIEVKLKSSYDPFRTSCESALMKAAVQSAREIYGMEPNIILNDWGSSGVCAVCGRLDIPCVMIGVMNEDSREHAPNENIYVEDYNCAIKMIASIITKIPCLK
ncbi:M20/M25/M40 family metallo-hydrolase [Cloacibacillus evryensis]|uniref:M20/M25/M40 family metallo-hydrolase n=1 Tax=Cloacibacillus evryensis TaxID=508460 RepID=UPI0026E09D76|nr:M20/M25/M40 family metallo-hydrolase [Cloacibacillus evryensis]